MIIKDARLKAAKEKNEAELWQLNMVEYISALNHAESVDQNLISEMFYLGIKCFARAIEPFSKFSSNRSFQFIKCEAKVFGFIS